MFAAAGILHDQSIALNFQCCPPYNPILGWSHPDMETTAKFLLLMVLPPYLLSIAGKRAGNVKHQLSKFCLPLASIYLKDHNILVWVSSCTPARFWDTPHF